MCIDEYEYEDEIRELQTIIFEKDLCIASLQKKIIEQERYIEMLKYNRKIV